MSNILSTTYHPHPHPHPHMISYLSKETHALLPWTVEVILKFFLSFSFKIFKKSLSPDLK